MKLVSFGLSWLCLITSLLVVVMDKDMIYAVYSACLAIYLLINEVLRVLDEKVKK